MIRLMCKTVAMLASNHRGLVWLPCQGDATTVLKARFTGRSARNSIIESTFEVGRCTMRVDCGELDPAAVIRPVAGEWRPRMPERLDEEGLPTGAPAVTPSISSPR